MKSAAPIVRWSGPLVGRRVERARLDAFVAAVHSGQSQVLVLRGEAGIGKSALLDHVATQAEGCRVLVGAGVEADTELAFAALHQVLSPLLDGVAGLPPPQRDAVKVAFGLLAAPAPDQVLVALAVLNLLSDAASTQPIVCLIDDEQWLDKASVHALAFVVRRLGAEAVGIVFAARRPDPVLDKLPELVVEGLDEGEARQLLESSLVGPIDPLVREQLLAETHGNPLALLELPRVVSPAHMAGGFALPSVVPLSERIEESFRPRLGALSPQTRRLLLLAAAEPTGNPSLLWQAADSLGIPRRASAAAVDASLVEIGVRVMFRHPLVRSAVYQSASLSEQREVHGALAAITDPLTDPDRRAWHRALATGGPDEEVARDLEQSALRAQARGGLAAAAIFLEWASSLTPGGEARSSLLLAAAAAKRDVGDLEAAVGLLAAANPAVASLADAARIKRLRGQIAFDRRHLEEGVRLFAKAARSKYSTPRRHDRRSERPCASRSGPATYTGTFGIEFAAAAVASARSPTGPVSPVDRVITAFASRYTDGREISAPLFTRAVGAFLNPDAGSDDVGQWYWLIQSRVSWMLALETWDAGIWRDLAAREVEVARRLGAAFHVKHGLNSLVFAAAFMGDLTAAEDFAHEARLIADVTGTPRLQYAEMVVAAYRGDAPGATRAISAILQEAEAWHVRLHVTSANWALALLNNSLGRHDVARTAGLLAFEGIDIAFGPLVVRELAEAAARTGDQALLEDPLGLVDYRPGIPPQPEETLYEHELHWTDPEVIHRYVAGYFVHPDPKVWGPLAEVLVRMTLSPDYPRWARAAALTFQMIYQQPVRYEYHLIEAPTLLIVGEEDHVVPLGQYATPAEAARLGDFVELSAAAAHGIPRATRVVVPDCGHIPHLEVPGQFLAALLPFLAS